MTAAYRQTWAPPFNDTVEPQRAGYCVTEERPDGYFFLVAYGYAPRGFVSEWGTSSKAKVFDTLSEARLFVAGSAGSVVITPPRWCGHAMLWDEVPA